MTQQITPQDILDLWFPDNGHWASSETHIAFWTERMKGGTDATICEDFADLTDAAARGHLWTIGPRHRAEDWRF